MPMLLIAEREFRTYVATLSFWLSLAIAPLAAGVVMLFSGGQPHPLAVSVQGGDSSLVQSASRALEEAARLEGHTLVFGLDGAKLIMMPRTPRALDVTFSGDFLLSAQGRAMVGHLIERDMARAEAGPNADYVVQQKTSDVGAALDTGRISRIVAMSMLWLTLTGSLGMLLQAVVRERANRALESLLAAAQGWEIVAGKMLGVGAVSLLVLGTWFGSALLFSLFLSPQDGLVPAILTALAQPLELLRYALIYVCAFAFYGAATVALGAMARDSASAQNAVRPMFVLLLAAFFVALASPGRPDALSWLAYLPPFTPFLLLVNSSETVASETQVILLAILLAAASLTVVLAAKLLSVAPRPFYIFKARDRRAQPVV